MIAAFFVLTVSQCVSEPLSGDGVTLTGRQRQRQSIQYLCNVMRRVSVSAEGGRAKLQPARTVLKAQEPPNKL